MKESFGLVCCYLADVIRCIVYIALLLLSLLLLCCMLLLALEQHPEVQFVRRFVHMYLMQ